jgi:hypothetical protein
MEQVQVIKYDDREKAEVSRRDARLREQLLAQPMNVLTKLKVKGKS